MGLFKSIYILRYLYSNFFFVPIRYRYTYFAATLNGRKSPAKTLKQNPRPLNYFSHKLQLFEQMNSTSDIDLQSREIVLPLSSPPEVLNSKLIEDRSHWGIGNLRGPRGTLHIQTSINSTLFKLTAKDKGVPEQKGLCENFFAQFYLVVLAFEK